MASPCWLHVRWVDTSSYHACTLPLPCRYGVVMWELLSWQLPFAESGFNTWQISGFITSGKRLEVPPLDKLPGPGMAEVRALVSLAPQLLILQAATGWSA